MLKPNKFLDLENCVINMSAEIIKILNHQNIISYSELYNKVSKNFSESIEYNFLPAIDFLYLLGTIKYSPITDSLELIK